MPIEIKHLDHIYMPGSPFETKALDDVTLTIGDGEFVGLIGHTGSGKSTLVQHLNGLMKPDHGSVIVDGMDVSDKNTDLREIRRRVGLVFQYPEHRLFEETVRKDVSFGPRNLGCSEQEIEERVVKACHQVGLSDEKLDMSPFDLSGGNKRRVAIAGVLAMRPRVLVLDEPTAGLDPRGRNESAGADTRAARGGWQYHRDGVALNGRYIRARAAHNRDERRPRRNGWHAARGIRAPAGAGRYAPGRARGGTARDGT